MSILWMVAIYFLDPFGGQHLATVKGSFLHVKDCQARAALVQKDLTEAGATGIYTDCLPITGETA